MLVKKEIISPDTICYIDSATGLPRKRTFKPEDIQRYCDTGKAMLAAGLSIPVPFEHQPDAVVLTPAQKAAKHIKDNAGWVHDYEVKDGKLFGTLDIQDPEVVKKLPHTIRWTSPNVGSFVDGNGKQWNDVISHVALTTRPRIIKQQPFTSMAAAMSFMQTVPDDKEPKDMVLSKAGILDVNDQIVKPRYPMAFSHFTGISLATEELVKEKKEEKTEPPAEAKSEETKGEEPPADGEKNPEDMGAEEALIDADGDISVCAVICDLLEAEGYQIPEGTTKENFDERLYAILMDKLKGKSEEPMTPTDPAATNPAPAANSKPPIVQEQPPMYMSLEQVNKIEDPNLKQMAQIALSLQNNALEAAKERRFARIERLAKKVKQTGFQDKLVAMAGGCQLSLSADGKIVDPMAPTLDILESGIRDLPSMLTTSAVSLSEVGHPQEYNGDMTEERRKKLEDEMCQRGGIK